MKDTALLSQYLESASTSHRTRDKTFVSILGQVARLCLLKGDVNIDELATDLGVLKLAQQHTFQHYAKWLKEHRSTSTQSSNFNQVKTGLLRLVTWLTLKLNALDETAQTPWVKKYDQGPTGWQPEHYTVAEARAMVDDVRSFASTTLKELGSNVRATTVTSQFIGQQSFARRYEDGLLM